MRQQPIFLWPKPPNYVAGMVIPTPEVPVRKITLDPPERLRAGDPYVVSPDFEKGTVAIELVSEHEWSRVRAGLLPGWAVRPERDIIVDVVHG